MKKILVSVAVLFFVIYAALELASQKDSYPISVDYERSVEDGVKAGLYDYTNPNITSINFKTKRKGKADLVVELVRFNTRISTDYALRELDRMGYRPVELRELLAFGEKYPEVQRKFPIIALGSAWWRRDGVRRVPCLYGSGSRRDLYLHWVEYGWGLFYRFAAVRK